MNRTTALVAAACIGGLTAGGLSYWKGNPGQAAFFAIGTTIIFAIWALGPPLDSDVDALDESEADP